jgi:hypothetical protein
MDAAAFHGKLLLLAATPLQIWGCKSSLVTGLHTKTDQQQLRNGVPASATSLQSMTIKIIIIEQHCPSSSFTLGNQYSATLLSNIFGHQRERPGSGMAREI